MISAADRAAPRLERLLVYGTSEMLAETVRSSESWLLRARCLEVLGMAAGDGDPDCAEAILELLVPGPAR